MIVGYIKSFFAHYGLAVAVALVYLFLYIPIFIVVIFSFNSVSFPYHWVSFSWQWYVQLFQSREIFEALCNSLIVATTSVVLSLTVGVLFVFYSKNCGLNRLTPLFYGSLLVPEIVIAVSLLSFFMICAIPLGLCTLIAGHTVLGLGYVIPILSARLAEVDASVIEASLDLGATINQTFMRIVLPLLSPALIASALLVFIISFDDFFISFFCAGTSAQTLSLYIFAMIRTGVSPTINALSTLLLLLSSICVLILCSLKTKIRIL